MASAGKGTIKASLGDEAVAPLLTTTYIRTNIPSRLDRLQWSRWHWLVGFSLGISWVMDGLIVSVVGLIGSQLEKKSTLGLTSSEVGALGTCYIGGAVVGSMLFGFLADRYGRKRLFLVTPSVYLLAALSSAFSWNYYWLAAMNVFTGLGIGGEYSAMNSAINEFIPARVRGMVDLAINGSYWLGACIGAASSILFLDEHIFHPNIGWRLPFGIAAIIGISIIVSRLFLPESPRWLLKENCVEEAERIVRDIERRANQEPAEGEKIPTVKVAIGKTGRTNFWQLIKRMAKYYRRQSFLGLALMVSQAFFYNAIFFTYALILNHYYHVPSAHIGYYEIPFCIGNFLGSALLGPLFDRVGRKPMITATYSTSAFLLILTGILFIYDKLNAITQTVCWSVIFFVSSAGSSSAYLTISEIFPLEVRALSIALFYSLGTGGGGLIGPVLFGALVQSGSRRNLFYGYIVGSTFMCGAAVAEVFFGVKAEGKPLEQITLEIEGNSEEAMEAAEEQVAQAHEPN